MRLLIALSLIFTFGLCAAEAAAAESQESENWLLGISKRLDKAYSLGEIENIAAIRSELLAGEQGEQDGGVGAPTADLVSYYVAMTHYRQGLVLGPEGADDLQACIDRLSQLTSQTPDFAEGHILTAACAGALIPMRPEQVMALSKVSGDAFEKGAELAPDNPRLLLINAISSLFSPPQFGGGSEPALEKLNAAVDLFQTSRQGDHSLPRWGLDEAYTWQGVIYSLEGEQVESMAALQLALSINPDNVWVKDILMPRVENGESLAPMFGM